MQELSVLISQGEAAIRSDVEKVHAILIGLSKQGESLDSPKYDDAFKTVLEACAYTGRGELDYDACLKLLAPFGRRFDDEADTRWQPLISALAERENINKGFVGNMLATARPPIAAPTASNPTFNSESSDQSPTTRQVDPDLLWKAVPSVGTVPDGTSFEYLAANWPGKDVLPASRRGDWIVWFLRSAQLMRWPLPISFLDEVSTDDEFWSSEEARKFSESLSEPPSPEVVGRVGAALLNSRLRWLRPRLFLRAPQSLVIEPIGDRTDLTRAEELVIEEIAYPFIRALGTLEREATRAGDRPPRRTVLKDLDGFLTQVLQRLGLAVIGKLESEEPFDPSGHELVGQADPGDPVVVEQPGLKDTKANRVVVKAIVRPIGAPKNSDEMERAEPSE